MEQLLGSTPTDEYFESLEDETEVPVIYAESNPNISKLESGQVFDGEFLDTPVGGYGLAGLGSLLALFLVVIGTLQLLGFDLGVPKA